MTGTNMFHLPGNLHEELRMIVARDRVEVYCVH